MSAHLAMARPLLSGAQVKDMSNGNIALASAFNGLVPSAYDSLNSVTLTSAINSVSFTNIPQNYSHLEIRYVVRSSAAQYDLNVFTRFNGDRNANYTALYIEGANTNTYTNTGGYASSYMLTGKGCAGSASEGLFGTGVILISDYTSTGKGKLGKTLSGYENGTTQSSIFYTSTWWSGTSAINSVTLLAGDGNFIAGSKFYLYGIRG